MAKNKSQITPDNFTEWLASTGFIFPRTIVELARFRKLYGDVQIELAGFEIDPDIILGYKQKTLVVSLKPKSEEIQEPKLRMAARKGGGTISKNIIDKIKKNQENRKQDDPGSSQETPE